MSAVDLDAFCAAPDDPREFLRQPFSIDGHDAASNAAMIIFVRATGTKLPECTGSSMARIREFLRNALEHAGKDGDWITADSLKTPTKPCHNCDGRGAHSATDCDECDGDGHFQYGKHQYECSECAGTGHIHQDDEADAPLPNRCMWCFGTGIEPQSVATQPGQRAYGVNSALLSLLRKLPNCALLRGAVDAIPVYFRFDGGCGALMPMRGPIEHHAP